MQPWLVAVHAVHNDLHREAHSRDTCISMGYESMRYESMGYESMGYESTGV